MLDSICTYFHDPICSFPFSKNVFLAPFSSKLWCWHNHCLNHIFWSVFSPYRISLIISPYQLAIKESDFATAVHHGSKETHSVDDVIRRLTEMIRCRKITKRYVNLTDIDGRYKTLRYFFLISMHINAVFGFSCDQNNHDFSGVYGTFTYCDLRVKINVHEKVTSHVRREHHEHILLSICGHQGPEYPKWSSMADVALHRAV